MIDNFIAFKKPCSEYEDDFLNICREGVSVGISIIITSIQIIGICYKYKSIMARRIPEVLENLDMDYINNNMKNTLMKEFEIPVGVGYDTIDIITIDLCKASAIGVAGKEKFGKTNFAKHLISYDYKLGWNYTSDGVVQKAEQYYNNLKYVY